MKGRWGVPCFHIGDCRQRPIHSRLCADLRVFYFCGVVFSLGESQNGFKASYRQSLVFAAQKVSTTNHVTPDKGTLVFKPEAVC